jgi:hypothetical protein
MKLSFPEIPGRLFEIDEVSAGVYRVFVEDAHGRSVSKTGTDPEALISECKQEVFELIGRGPIARGDG